MRRRRLLITTLTISWLAACGPQPGEPVAETSEQPADEARALVEEYLQRHLAFRPSRATADGFHEHDAELEDLSPQALDAWLAWNRETARRAAGLLADASLPTPERLDLELLERQARREVFDLDVRRRHETDPLFWTETIANATVFLLVREDRPDRKSVV